VKTECANLQQLYLADRT